MNLSKLLHSLGEFVDGMLLLLVLFSYVCVQAGQKRKAEPIPDATKSKVKKK